MLNINKRLLIIIKQRLKTWWHFNQWIPKIISFDTQGKNLTAKEAVQSFCLDGIFLF